MQGFARTLRLHAGDRRATVAALTRAHTGPKRPVAPPESARASRTRTKKDPVPDNAGQGLHRAPGRPCTCISPQEAGRLSLDHQRIANRRDLRRSAEDHISARPEKRKRPAWRDRRTIAAGTQPHGLAFPGRARDAHGFRPPACRDMTENDVSSDNRFQLSSPEKGPGTDAFRCRTPVPAPPDPQPEKPTCASRNGPRSPRRRSWTPSATKGASRVT